MKVLKFGGTSVKTSDNIKKVISIVNDISSETTTVVVVSALGGITDLLHQSAKQASIADPNYINTFKEIQKRHNNVLIKLLSKRNKKVINSLTSLLDELEGLLKGIFLVKELSPKSLDYILSFGERLSSLLIYESFVLLGLSIRYINSIDCIKTDDKYGNAKVDFLKTRFLFLAFQMSPQDQLAR